MGDMDNPELRRTLEKGIDEWISETRRVRDSFSILVTDQNINLLRASDDEEASEITEATPICAECQFQVPKLEFLEFDLSEDKNPRFRGQELPVPVGSGA